MKTTASRENSTRSHSSQPFFGKKNKGGFFSPVKEVAEPFFSPAVIQPKLTINEPGDRYEQEADAMSDRVMRMETTPGAPMEEGQPIQTMPLAISRLQRQESEEEEPVQMMPLTIQRKCAECEQEAPVQTMHLMRKSQNGGYQATPQLTSQLSQSKGGGSPLPKPTLSFMNGAFGSDFSHVRVHTGSEAQEMSQGIQAKAFTHGADIYFNRGQYSPESSEGKRLLAHELVHVGQQRGRAKAIQLRQSNTANVPGYNHLFIQEGEKRLRNKLLKKTYFIGENFPYIITAISSKKWHTVSKNDVIRPTSKVVLVYYSGVPFVHVSPSLGTLKGVTFNHFVKKHFRNVNPINFISQYFPDGEHAYHRGIPSDPEREMLTCNIFVCDVIKNISGIEFLTDRNNYITAQTLKNNLMFSNRNRLKPVLSTQVKVGDVFAKGDVHMGFVKSISGTSFTKLEAEYGEGQTDILTNDEYRFYRVK